MADQFETFLARSLEPPERDPDRLFIARVQARIVLEDRLRANRNAELRELGLQIVALCAVAAGLLCVSRSENVIELTAESPALSLAVLLGGFGLLVALFSTRERGPMLNG